MKLSPRIIAGSIIYLVFLAIDWQVTLDITGRLLFLIAGFYLLAVLFNDDWRVWG